MNKTYSVLYKNGTTQIVTGNLVLFSIHKTELIRIKNAVYLNASEIVSIEEV